MPISIFGGSEDEKDKKNVNRRWIDDDDYGVLATAKRVRENGSAYANHLGWINADGFSIKVLKYSPLSPHSAALHGATIMSSLTRFVFGYSECDLEQCPELLVVNFVEGF